MGAILLAFGLVGGIVGLAAAQADNPTIKRFLQKRRLYSLAKKPDSKLTLLEAEDGVLLSRRYMAEDPSNRFLLTRFTKLVASLKKQQQIKDLLRRQP
jgi:hypothetical protein